MGISMNTSASYSSYEQEVSSSQATFSGNDKGAVTGNRIFEEVIKEAFQDVGDMINGCTVYGVGLMHNYR